MRSGVARARTTPIAGDFCMNQLRANKLDRIASRYQVNPKVSGLALAIEQPSTGFSRGFGKTDQPYFIASITNLVTTTMIMQVCHEGKLTLDTPAAQIIGAQTMNGLVGHNGHDYGTVITVRELLSQRSGISDFFE